LRRRTFLQGATSLSAAFWGLSCSRPQTASAPPEWCWEDVPSLIRARAEGRLTSATLVGQCLERIRQFNPGLKAVIEVNPEVESLARLSHQTGPLAGIPVLIKDNLATADQQITSAGSAALAGSRYPHEAVAVQKLRKAGLLPLGKANMSEWGNLRASRPTSGWSARGGQCVNPYDFNRTPSGSSSGCAAAVAAGLVPLALGTETMGSITCPASICGIVGLKPTHGLIPLEGMIPIAPSFDCLGPMARSVTDVAIMLEILAEPTRDYRKQLQRGALRGVRLGVARSCWGEDPRVHQLMEEQLSILSRLGAQLVDPVEVPRLRGVVEDFSAVLRFEFKAGVNRYLAAQSADVAVRSLADVIRFNRQNPELEGLNWLDQDLLLQAEASPPLTHPRYRQALGRLASTAGPDRMSGFMDRHQIQAVVAPTTGPAWIIDPSRSEPFHAVAGAAPAVAGLPHITLPAGQIDGLPSGISFYSRRHTEPMLLGLAYDYEQENAYRFRPPL